MKVMSVEDAVLRDFLIDAGLVSRSRLDDALRALQDGRTLAQILGETGMMSADEVRHAQAHAMGIPFVTFDPRDISEDAMLLIPEPLARTHNIFAYKSADGAVEVAVLDLGSLAHAHELKRTYRVLPRLTSAESMKKALVHYQKHLREKFGEILTNGQHVAEALIKHAIYSRAGGVHVEPSHLGMLVRYQIGHALHEAFTLPEQAGKQLVAQLKTLAKLLPVARAQEGKFKVEHDNDRVHVRVHTLPTTLGERVHMRLAREKHGAQGFTLESLGFHGEALEAMERAMHKRQGLVVAIGLGRSTLLKTLADLLREPHVVVVEAANATEARVALKHDPDVLVLDDVKDESTANLARTAADRGVFVVAASPNNDLRGDIEVRLALVRRLCTKAFHHSNKFSRAEGSALEPYADFVKVLNALKEEHVIEPTDAWKDVEFARASPCSECKGGYSGHIGLQEVAGQGGVIGLSLIEDGLFKAASNLTSVDEVLGLLE